MHGDLSYRGRGYVHDCGDRNHGHVYDRDGYAYVHVHDRVHDHDDRGYVYVHHLNGHAHVHGHVCGQVDCRYFDHDYYSSLREKVTKILTAGHCFSLTTP